RHAGPVHPLSRRRSRDDRSPVRPSRSIAGARRGRAAAGARRNNQGDRQSVPAALLDHARHEGGVPGLYMSGWFGFFAPKGTPKDIVGKLNGARVQALADPAVRGRFADLGLDVASREQQTPEGLAAFHKAEIEKWWPIIKAANIKAE